MTSYRTLSIVASLIAALMLVATVAYPFGYDQSVFSVGGAIVFAGKIPFRDFIDTKQPLIFYLYGLAQWMFGPHPWSIHLFDVGYHLIGSFYFYRILRRTCSMERSLFAVSAVIILYAGSGFWMTCQAESFAFIPSLVLLDSTLRAASAGPMRSKGSIAMLGSLGGASLFVLLSLKFTFILAGVAVFLFLLLKKSIRSTTKRSFAFGLIGSFAVGIIVSLLLLSYSGVLAGFSDSIVWLWHYGSISDPAHGIWEQLFLRFPERLLLAFSVGLFVLAAIGLWRWKKNERRSSLLQLLLLTGFFQLVGVLLERKIEFPYHYTRAVWAFSPFISMGLEDVLRWKVSRWLRYAVGVILLVLSPIYHLFTQSIPWFRIAVTGDDAASEVQRRIPDYFAEDQQKLAAYLAPRLSPSEHLFVWGNDVGIYFLLHHIPTTMCLTATPFRTSFTPLKWKSELLWQIKSNPPRYFIIEHGDAKPYITGSALDSYQALQQWNELESFLSEEYHSNTAIGHFQLFEKR